MQKIFQQYYTALCLFSYRIVDDDLLAQDIVQEAFIRLNEEMKNGKMQSCRSWLYTTVRNASLNALNKKKKYESDKRYYTDYLLTGENIIVQDVEKLLIRSEVSGQLWKGLYRLPPKMQQILRMHFLECMSIREISSALRLHVSTVKTQKQRGITLLRKYISFLALITGIFSFCNFFY